VLLVCYRSSCYELCRIVEFITLVLHHRESIERDENQKLKYVGGEIDVWDDINSDLLNLFDLKIMVKKVGVTTTLLNFLLEAL
jgi:hypothetical protein